MSRENRLRLSLAIIGTAAVLLLTAYTLVQQAGRHGANDLPLAAAQTIRHQLESGAKPADVVPQTKTDSLSDNTVFAIVTDNQPKVLASSLNDEESALPPRGVFEYTASHSIDQVTWQTGSGARLATTVIPYKGGFIVAGQSLSRVEQRVKLYTALIAVAFIVVLAWVFLTLWFYV